jgi:hypothetical protein
MKTECVERVMLGILAAMEILLGTTANQIPKATAPDAATK